MFIAFLFPCSIILNILAAIFAATSAYLFMHFRFDHELSSTTCRGSKLSIWIWSFSSIIIVDGKSRRNFSAIRIKVSFYSSKAQYQQFKPSKRSKFVMPWQLCASMQWRREMTKTCLKFDWFRSTEMPFQSTGTCVPTTYIQVQILRFNFKTFSYCIIWVTVLFGEQKDISQNDIL